MYSIYGHTAVQGAERNSSTKKNIYFFIKYSPSCRSKPLINSNATDRFKAHKISKDIIEILQVVSAVQP